MSSAVTIGDALFALALGVACCAVLLFGLRAI